MGSANIHFSLVLIELHITMLHYHYVPPVPVDKYTNRLHEIFFFSPILVAAALDS